MGPVDHFSREKVLDDLSNYRGFEVWGLLAEDEERNRTDLKQFLDGLIPESKDDVFIGRISPMNAFDLTKPASWTNPSLLNFGSDNVKAPGASGYRTEFLLPTNPGS